MRNQLELFPIREVEPPPERRRGLREILNKRDWTEAKQPKPEPPPQELLKPHQTPGVGF